MLRERERLFRRQIVVTGEIVDRFDGGNVKTTTKTTVNCMAPIGEGTMRGYASQATERTERLLHAIIGNDDD